MKRLIVATTNAGKARELSLALSDLAEWVVETLPPDQPAVDETGRTFLENAVLKAEFYSRINDDPVLADDSGLCVDALGGQPGIHSARYPAETPTAEGRNERILKELGDLPESERTAAFYCAIAIAHGGKLLWTTQTELRGRIATQSSGQFGFGYDPIFVVPQLHKTLAEMTTIEKNRASARGRAVRLLREFLQSW